MIVVRRQIRRSVRPQSMRAECHKPCRFVRVCGNQSTEVSHHRSERARSHTQRQFGYTLSEHVLWDTYSVQTGSVTAKLTTSFKRSRPCLHTVEKRLAYSSGSLGQPLPLEGNHGIRS